MLPPCCSSPRLQQSPVAGQRPRPAGTRATSFLGDLQLPRSPAPPRLLLLEKRLHLVSTRHLPRVSPSPLNSPFLAPCVPPVDWDIQTCNKSPWLVSPGLPPPHCSWPISSRRCLVPGSLGWWLALVVCARNGGVAQRHVADDPHAQDGTH
jgi:hypothetical protein